MGLQHIIVLQNKIDLIKKDSAKLNYMEIRKFIQGTPAGEKVYTLNFEISSSDQFMTIPFREQSYHTNFCSAEI